MTQNIDSVFEKIKLERQKQHAKWGEQNHKPIEWMAILMEEVGEASKEALDHHFQNPVKLGDGTISEAQDIDQAYRMMKFREELVQVAAVTVQILECLDRNWLELIQKNHSYPLSKP